jgi:hypothetical protein
MLVRVGASISSIHILSACLFINQIERRHSSQAETQAHTRLIVVCPRSPYSQALSAEQHDTFMT